ncbi:MAG TPA: hypothetical protein VM942_09330 [Acidimicrobiales bacterium]|nr:hypothetical protein [Acidimicrobiales bacterium]
MILYCPRCGAKLADEFRGASFETRRQCSDCGVASADPPRMLAPSDAEVTYGLDEWPVEDRVALTGALAEDGIPYRWEAGIVLSVPETVEEVVDAILDDLESAGDDQPGEDEPGEGGADEEAADGGEEAQAAMVDLFVLADRLQHVPSDKILVGELVVVAETAAASRPPYGIGESVWQQITELAFAVLEAEDDLAVMESSVALRDYLRPFV